MLNHPLSNIQKELFYPPEAPISDVKVPAPAKTADDINDMFKELDKEAPPEEKTEKKESKPKDKEDKEEKLAEGEDDDLELLEPDEDIEKLDLKESDDIDIEAPPRKKEILKEYPELFKKFPFLEKMMYRDRQITELFGSFDDAKEVAERSENFSAFESQLLSGDTKEILRGVKEADPKAFDAIVDDYLPALAAVDKDAYFHVVGNLNKRLIMEMVQEANDTNNEDLKQAALLVNQFVFGTAKFTAPANRIEKTKESDTAKDEVEQERLNFAKERFETSRDELQTRVDNTLRATISSYIDPKNVMSSYVKKNAISDAMKILSSAIASDEGTVRSLDKLWRAAFEDKFSKNSLGKIQSYYLSKAKGNLKNAIIKARTEALKELAPKRERDEEIEEPEDSRRPVRTITPGRPSNKTGKSSGPQKGESVTDFFMRD